MRLKEKQLKMIKKEIKREIAQKGKKKNEIKREIAQNGKKK